MRMTGLELYKESACTCFKCSSMCRRPCWGKPHEIRHLIENGYGRYLMLDYWTCEDEPDIAILCPALKGSERMRAPFIPQSKDGCIFWRDGLCELHDLNLKPIEGRLAIHDSPHHEDIHEKVAQLWNTEEAKAMVADWIERFCEEHSYLL